MGKKVYKVNGALFEVDERYQVIKPIGMGAYGLVVSAKDNKNNEKVAIKKIPKVFQDLVDGKRILREIKLLSSFNHENIISIKDIMTIDDEKKFSDVYIVSELMDTDLHHVIKSRQKLSTAHIQYFIYQILRGLKYIHSAHVLHRDLKPSNILVNGNCDLKICDFGLARGYDPESFSTKDMTEYVVTRWYRAPELLLMCQEYTDAIDIWSVGCILGELLNRQAVFPGKDYITQLALITNALGTPDPQDYQHVKHKEALRYLKQLPKKKPVPFKELFPTANADELDLLQRMLVFNPEKRITTKQALSHPYLKGLHDETDEPVSNTPFLFEFDDREISEVDLRKFLYTEFRKFHPEESTK